jgi:hypothetical protein
VLDQGPLPLDVLEQKVTNWIRNAKDQTAAAGAH